MCAFNVYQLLLLLLLLVSGKPDNQSMENNKIVNIAEYVWEVWDACLVLEFMICSDAKIESYFTLKRLNTAEETWVCQRTFKAIS